MTNSLINKTIILGVTGSVAAYKAVELASRLHQSGAIVEVIMTESACRFVTPLSFQSVTSRKAYTDADLWGSEGHVTHVSLGHAADFMVIAPATANTLAKMAHGIGDNLLSVATLAARCKVLVAPAMDVGMYDHAATQDNVALLKQRGVLFIGPDEGHLASGLTGPGRLKAPQEILSYMRYLLGRDGALAGKKVVVTAGGTQEPLDPVRVITNRSSGRQGYAIAQSALDSGAEVILISGQTSLETPGGIRRINVRTVNDMLDAVMSEIDDADALIMAAAPADFRPAQVAAHKIKKDAGVTHLELEYTTDILSTVAQHKKQTGYPCRVIGFAAESQDLIQNARKKLEKKCLDLIVANDITAQDAGFEVNTNRVTLLYANGDQEELPRMTKDEVADHIIQRLGEWLAVVSCQ